MNQPKFFLSAIFGLSLIFALSLAAHGQTDTRPQVEPSYEVSLQLLIGSNDATQRTDVPANLAAISKQLRSTFTFSNYRLATTFLGRISNNGNFEYKSVTNIFGQESTASSQTFLDWSVANFRTGPTAKGAPGFQAQAFHFGARVPVLVGGAKDENGKMSPVVNYESIGLGLGKMGFAENVPTLIGTLNLPGADGTIFLVMTVRSADL
jgi:hypothetical protein